MSYGCPVCNGLEELSFPCEQCREALDDQGRLSDFYDPYSPYRPIDDIKLTNGYEDLSTHQCIHLGRCSHCHRSYTLAVQEQQL
ncbi:hypothetical protein [Paenibacillus silviterrae]|uniref:hypothetical protein n=1 Tax=Paenibacillus silviterrae TaxID=3242194 RepID=UPI0025436ADE|nr:hypothetical protein [Paenibacillus chinjuensis]